MRANGYRTVEPLSCWIEKPLKKRCCLLSFTRYVPSSHNTRAESNYSDVGEDSSPNPLLALQNQEEARGPTFHTGKTCVSAESASMHTTDLSQPTFQKSLTSFDREQCLGTFGADNDTFCDTSSMPSGMESMVQNVSEGLIFEKLPLSNHELRGLSIDTSADAAGILTQWPNDPARTIVRKQMAHSRRRLRSEIAFQGLFSLQRNTSLPQQARGRGKMYFG